MSHPPPPPSLLNWSTVPWCIRSNTEFYLSNRTRKFQKTTLCNAVQCFNNKKLGFLTEKTCSIFFSEDSHNTQRTHFWCVSGWIYAIQLSDKDCGVLYIGMRNKVFILLTKVSSIVQCTKIQLITSQNFNIKTCFSKFLWFFC